jgi:hypothetical protein
MKSPEPKIEQREWRARAISEYISSSPSPQVVSSPVTTSEKSSKIQSAIKAAQSKICLKALALLAVLSATIAANSQSYSIDWSTIGGGGGTSTGGVYSLSGTIGQAGAGNMGGGNYTLVGGFWGILAAVQTRGAPLLTITVSGTNAIISWSSDSIGFVLEQNAALEPTNWTGVAQTPSDNGTTRSVTVQATVGNRFYRLKR